MNKADAIRNYLAERMPGYDISLSPAKPVRPFGFRLEKDGYEYIVEFEEDFLADRETPEIIKALEEWRVLDELCRGEGLRYVVTNRGLRLDSSN